MTRSMAVVLALLVFLISPSGLLAEANSTDEARVVDSIEISISQERLAAVADPLSPAPGFMSDAHPIDLAGFENLYKSYNCYYSLNEQRMESLDVGGQRVCNPLALNEDFLVLGNGSLFWFENETWIEFTKDKYALPYDVYNDPNGWLRYCDRLYLSFSQGCFSHEHTATYGDLMLFQDPAYGNDSIINLRTMEVVAEGDLVMNQAGEHYISVINTTHYRITIDGNTYSRYNYTVFTTDEKGETNIILTETNASRTISYKCSVGDTTIMDTYLDSSIVYFSRESQGFESLNLTRPSYFWCGQQQEFILY